MLQQPEYFAGVPVGDRVVQFVDTFDTDATIRCSFVAALYESAGHEYDRIETAATCKNMTLMDLASNMPSRERAIALFGHYQISRDDFLRGSTEILPPDPFMVLAELPIQVARSEWIGNPACHQPLDNLMAVLAKCVRSFNIGLVASYLMMLEDKALATIPIFDDADIDRAKCELLAVIMYAYAEGRQILDTEYPTALEALMESIPRGAFLAALLDPPEFLIRLMIEGRNPDHDQQAGPEPPTIMTFPLPPGYEKTPSGLVLPKIP